MDPARILVAVSCGLLAACAEGNTPKLPTTEPLVQQRTSVDWRKAYTARVRLGLPLDRFEKTDGVPQGMVNAKLKVKAILSRLLSANGLPENVAGAGVYACDDAAAYSDRHSRWINVCRGMLAHVENEDQLAFVMGHELGHILIGEAEALKSARTAENFSQLLGFQFGFGILAPVNASITESAQSSRMAVVRDDETSADLVGLELMYGAGYNPTAAVRWANRIHAEKMADLESSRRIDALTGGSLKLEQKQLSKERSPLLGLNILDHPNGQDRAAVLAAATAEKFSGGANRAFKPHSFSGEVDQWKRASLSIGYRGVIQKGWEGDPELAIQRARRLYSERLAAAESAVIADDRPKADFESVLMALDAVSDDQAKLYTFMVRAGISKYHLNDDRRALSYVRRAIAQAQGRMIIYNDFLRIVVWLGIYGDMDSARKIGDAYCAAKRENEAGTLVPDCWGGSIEGEAKHLADEVFAGENRDRFIQGSIKWYDEMSMRSGRKS